jgi:hypothetical protein
MNYGELETLVNYDMHTLGYDHTDPEHIDAYWEVMLSDD